MGTGTDDDATTDRSPGTEKDSDPAEADPPVAPPESEHVATAARDADEAAPSTGVRARIGRPLSTRSPFAMGFMGAAGALLAYWLGTLVLRAGSSLLLIVVALFLAFGLNPAVERLMRRGLKRSWSVLIVAIGVVVGISLFVVAIAPVATDQVAELTKNAPGWLDQLLHNKRIERLDDKYDVVAKAQSYLTSGDLTQRLFGGALGVSLAILGAFAQAFVIVVLTLYFLATLPQVKSSLYRLAPASRRERVSVLGDRILDGVGGYVSGAFIVAMCAGISTLVFLFIVGLGEFAVALAVVVAILDVIPMIGATIGAVLVSAIGFATDVKMGIACVIFFAIYQQVENYVVYPRVMSRAVDIPGSVTVIAALIGAALLGVVGALLAIPTAAAVLLLTRELFIRKQDAR